MASRWRLPAVWLIACAMPLTGGCGGDNGGADGTARGLAASGNANLAGLSLSTGVLDQIFDPDQRDYTASLGYLAAGVRITAVAEDPDASVKVNDVNLVTDTSDIVALAEGSVTRVSVTVIAADGVTNSEYVIDIDRADLADLIQQRYVKPDVIDSMYVFGSSVALDGDWLAVGMPGDNSRARSIDGDDSDNSGVAVGSVVVFRRDSGGVWMSQAYVKASNADDNDAFGAAVALSGSTLVVGAYGEQSRSGDRADNSGSAVGAAYVFVRDANDQWIHQAYLKASNADDGDQFGRFLDLDGNTLVVGAIFEDSAGDEDDNSLADAGAAYVFTRDSDGLWSQQAYVKPSSIDDDDRFGGNLAIAGDVLVVGVPREDGDGINGDPENNNLVNAGAVFVFERDEGIWTESAYLKASNADENDLFGANPELEDNVLMVAAIGERSRAQDDPDDDSGSAVGAVYEFTRDDTGAWSQTAYIKAPNADDGDEFGSGVAYEGNALIVGARGEAGATAGINVPGGVADNSGNRVGAAYIYIRDADSTWHQVAYVKASNPDDGDEFGEEVAFDGDGLVITAPGEDGDGSSEADNSLLSSGAGYLLR